MDPTATGFMIAESRSQPMQVGGLHLFEPPEGADPEFVRRLFDGAVGTEKVASAFIRRPVRSVTTAGQWFWTDDDQFDVEHHVRHSALPRPGRVRELLELVGRLHGTQLNLERPLWETHYIEGLADGRFATYTKIHHAVLDGIAAMRLLQTTLSGDPDERDMPAWFADRPRTARVVEDRPSPGVLELPAAAVRSALGVAADAAGLPSALVKTLSRGVRDEPTTLSFAAPRTILNRSITGARRFAAEDWPLERIKGVSRASGTTLNDVVLAMCSGALRSYLLELDALPDSSLVAMVPVNIRGRGAKKGAKQASPGNAVGTIMVRLGTDLTDPADRLEQVHTSMVQGKKALASMTPLQILAMSGIGVSPSVLVPLLRLQGIARPPFNLVISNVPGPRRPLYLNGARMTGTYPLSVPMHGQALNITCVSYVDQLAFGLTGCRRTAPHLQRLLGHLDTELAALERAAGVAAATG
jgi:diacylglycerol O-acyltransferase